MLARSNNLRQYIPSTHSNRFKWTTRTSGRVQTWSVFVAITWSLHALQYHVFFSSSVSEGAKKRWLCFVCWRAELSGL